MYGILWFAEEEFEDTKGAIRIRISKKNRQHNGQKKEDKRTNNDILNIQIKLKIEYTNLTKNQDVTMVGVIFVNIVHPVNVGARGKIYYNIRHTHGKIVHTPILDILMAKY